jgi:Uri superfamily endonuclease
MAFEKEMAENRTRGTYILILNLLHAREIRIGRLGSFRFHTGYYAYVGSAFSPGGLAGRLKHHLNSKAKHHWHIDYLCEFAGPVQVWVTEDKIRREHHWAAVLTEFPGAVTPVKGFGSSDCKCKTHLFYFGNPPSLRLFQGHLLKHYPDHSPVECIRIAR